MYSFILAVVEGGLPICLLVTLVEVIWHKGRYNKEYTRKFIHISAGLYIATWPLFISWRNIQFLAVGATLSLIAARQLKIYKAMLAVDRGGLGDIFCGVVGVILPLITHSELIFALAVVELSLADGMAAVIGLKYGTKNRYKIFGVTKSVAGTSCFLLVSLLILSAAKLIDPTDMTKITWLAVSAIAVVLTMAENIISVYGLDNLALPLITAFCLKL